MPLRDEPSDTGVPAWLLDGGGSSSMGIHTSSVGNHRDELSLAPVCVTDQELF